MRRILALCLMGGFAAGPAAAKICAVDELGSLANAPAYEQRKDVREITLPPLPTGPANPPGYCSPSNPLC
jgi:hypothetical protein